jgi:hypothetical protein
MHTCPNCKGTGNHDEEVSEALASSVVLSTLALVRPSLADATCMVCKGSGKLDDAALQKLRKIQNHDRRNFALLVFVLLVILALSLWWLKGQFEIYG